VTVAMRAPAPGEILARGADRPGNAFVCGACAREGSSERMKRHPLLVVLAASFACSNPSTPAETPKTAARDTEVLASTEESPPARAAIGDEKVQALVGGYRHSGGQAEQDGLANAVDLVVKDMNVLAREIARKRLLEANRIPAALKIATQEDLVTIMFDDRSYTATLGGPAVDVVGITGDPLRMTLKMREASLVQRFVGSKGNRTNTMRRSGDEVRIAVVVESDSLPRDLVYELTFTRP